MNRKLLTLIVVLFCILNINANNTKPKLYLVYSEHCSYSQDLLNNTIADQNIQNILAKNFEYTLLEQETEEAKSFIEKHNISGFPTQVIIKEKSVLFAYGALSIENQTDFLNTTKNLDIITAYFYPSNKEEFQVADPFGKFVFRETGLGFDQENKKLLIPKTGDPYYKGCYLRPKPSRYVCNGGGGGASHNFLTKGKKDGDFKVAIFHPLEKTRNSRVSITSFVEDGKVTQQSKCYYGAQGVGFGTINKVHFIIRRMECYVASAELCKVINEVETVDDLRDEDRFQRFLNVLKSPRYKKLLLEVYKYNFEKSFLHRNRENHYEYYSQLDEKRYYSEERHGKLKSTRILEFEKSLAMQQSKSLYDLASKAKSLFGQAFLGPCKNFALNNMLAEPKSE